MNHGFVDGQRVRIVSLDSVNQGKIGTVRSHASDGYKYNNFHVCVEIDDTICSRVFLAPKNLEKLGEVVDSSSQTQKNNKTEKSYKVNTVKTMNISVDDPELVDSIEGLAYHLYEEYGILQMLFKYEPEKLDKVTDFLKKLGNIED